MGASAARKGERRGEEEKRKYDVHRKATIILSPGVLEEIKEAQRRPAERAVKNGKREDRGEKKTHPSHPRGAKRQIQKPDLGASNLEPELVEEPR